MPTKKTTAIQKKAPVLALAKLTNIADDALQNIAKALSQDLTPPQLAEVYSPLQRWEKALKALRENTRDRLLELVKAKGRPTTDKGSLEARLGEYVVPATIRKSGHDDKKVSAFLATKNIPLMDGMDAEVKYKSNEAKLQALVLAGKITEDELKTLEVEPQYNLKEPKLLQPEG